MTRMISWAWHELHATLWMARHNGRLWWTCSDCRAMRRTGPWP